MTTMLASLDAAMDRAGMTAHRDAARPSDSRGESNLTQDFDPCGNDCFGPDGHAEGCPWHCSCYSTPPRRMVAVTVALSEPADGSPLDWSETVASVLRLAFTNTSVHVIDTWRNDQ